MMLMRRKIASPALSQKSAISPNLSFNVGTSPYLSLHSPTPSWAGSPAIGSGAPSPGYDTSAGAQIAWAAYQGCFRRINGACVVSRAQAVDEQRSWWEETSNQCRSAILLHNATLNKKYDFETARNLELLENAAIMVQNMLDSLSYTQPAPIVSAVEPWSRAIAVPTPTIIINHHSEPAKQPKQRSGFASVFSRFMSNLPDKDAPPLETQKMGRPDEHLY